MIGICPKCGNYEWDKLISEDKNRITCPKCRHEWGFKAMPLFILTGCSGVGKTTTAQELQQRDINFIVMDSDYLFNLMPHETEEDYKNLSEQIMSLSRNIMQGGKPLLWTKAGALEYFEDAYNRRFFTNIHYLALVCDSKDLEMRMREGRGIASDDWIQGSIDYNRWFMENGILEDGKTRQQIETFNITAKSVSEVADYVIEWVNGKLC